MFFSRVAGVLRKFEYEIVTGCTQTRRARTRIVRVLGLRTRACADATRRRRRRRGGALPWDVEETARFTRFCKARLFPKCSSRVVARGRFKDVTADGVINTRRARPRAVHATGCNLFVKSRCAPRYERLVHAYSRVSTFTRVRYGGTRRAFALVLDEWTSLLQNARKRRVFSSADVEATSTQLE